MPFSWTSGIYYSGICALPGLLYPVSLSTPDKTIKNHSEQDIEQNENQSIHLSTLTASPNGAAPLGLRSRTES